MSAQPIPDELWAQMKEAARITERCDQWGEYGHFCVDDVVHTYSIDRKDQFDMLHASRVLPEFLDLDLPAEVRTWAQGLSRDRG